MVIIRAGRAQGARPTRPLIRVLVLVLFIGALYQSGIYREMQKLSATIVLGGTSESVRSVSDLYAPAAAEEKSDDKSGGPIAAADAEILGSYPRWSKEEIDKRCKGTKGDWCRGYYEQKPIPAKAPPRGNKTCLWGCNFVGVCDHYSGWCRCPAGWTGDDCITRKRRPCSWHQRLHGFEPDDTPPDLTQPSSLSSRCAQLCDEDIGYCFCNSTWTFGHELADLDQPPGTPPKRRGRPLGMHCQPSKNDAGESINWGINDPSELWGPEGWCTAEKPKIRCPCILDGYDGDYCDQIREQFCLNQCNGHGECNLGFCKCHEGWWGHDCAYRTEGTKWSPGYEDGARPWVKEFVDTPAAKDPEPGEARLRPLIYVYELPPLFNQVMLQYRVDHGTCVHRFFSYKGNGTNWNDDWGYVAETALHEALLMSTHRTLDPEEADYFYLPVYSSCYLYPIHGFSDSPFFHSFHDISRVHGAINMLIEVHAWIRSHFPFWDRNGGQDHIVLQTHDEGSCWLPAVLRPAILFTHWGRLDLGHISNTGYPGDNYTHDIRNPVYMPEGVAGKLGDFPCYNPKKDLVIPPMTSAEKYRHSPLVGAPAQERSIFAFFKGRTQQTNEPYSRGIRQTLENLCRDKKWFEKHNIWIGEGNPPGLERSYSEILGSATFCFVLPGDGFSPRFEDAVHHGCIPVIIQDEVHLGFESILDFDTFAIRILQKDMKRVPQILKAIKPEEIEAKQKVLAMLWRKWAYTGYKPYGKLTLQYIEEWKGMAEPDEEPLSLPHPERDYNPYEADAMEVIYAWLYSRIPHTRDPIKAGTMESIPIKSNAGRKEAVAKEPERELEPKAAKVKDEEPAKEAEQKEEAAEQQHEEKPAKEPELLEAVAEPEPKKEPEAAKEESAKEFETKAAADSEAAKEAEATADSEAAKEAEATGDDKAAKEAEATADDKAAKEAAADEKKEGAAAEEKKEKMTAEEEREAAENKAPVEEKKEAAAEQ